MKKLLILLMLVYSLYASETNNFVTVEYWKQDDKQGHFRRSAEIAIVATAIARQYDNSKLASFLIGVGSTVMIGWAKEVYDGTQDNHTKDIDDLDADFLGAIAGASGASQVGLISFSYEWEF